ncbi:methyltransferase domain-containing protein [archaeon]|nr:methyltransferase domain-containing protein [archaeon]
MKQFFVLNQENLDLSKGEVLALTISKKCKLIDNLLILDNKEKLDRLAMTKSIYKLLFITTQKQLIKKIKSFDWQKEYKENFRIRLHHFTNLTEKDLAKYVYEKIKNPKVNLENPTTSYEFFFVKNKVIAGKLLYELNEDFKLRHPQYWPEHHPSGMKPRMSRCLINLTGIKKGKFYDAMCGAGGFLIEAGLMGFSVVGYDLDEIMVRRAEINIKHFGIKNFKVKKQDATKIKHKIKYLATDLPYGKSTRKLNRNEVYLAFLKNLKKILKGTAVIVFPDFSPYKKLIKEANLEINREFSVYIHHTLTRKIVVIKQ